MKYFLSLFLICYFSHFSTAQNTKGFQQKVNYQINVILDDEKHTLAGDIQIDYQNNAPTVLNEIWMHLWPNAYKNINTAFAQQMVRTGNTEFYFSEPSDYGYLDNVNFKINGNSTTWDYDKDNPDIAKITLAQPLKSGEKLTIQTSFVLKIPESFSRLGHVDQSYQLTQWFPKPAVYDHKGWHPMPYLNMGEFYSEFGDFQVTITLPENYIVGATGVLQTESEKEFLQQKIEETKAYFEKEAAQKTDTFGGAPEFPASSEKMKTLIYTAKNVHDFAWFADKRFFVQKGEATLQSGKKIDTWTMFTERQSNYWQKSIEYVNRSVEFYSKMVGEYPWPQATAVQSALSAGGGMEYPMITVIGLTNSPKALDEVITHEVGHNWFYGILASNERDYPWMDEGLNSYYEYRYMGKYYDGEVSDLEGIPKFLTENTSIGFSEAAYLFPARKQKDQAPNTHSDDFIPLNYGVSAYVKPALALEHLEAYLGQTAFDEAMQNYYQKWAFKHPYPEDFRAVLEEKTGKNLAWLFDGYLFSNKKMDYAIGGISNEGNNLKLSLKNKGELNAPFPISGLKDGKIVDTHWFEGFVDEQEVTFPNGDYDELILDAGHQTLELYRKNNNIKLSGAFKKAEPISFSLAPAIENPRKSTVYWSPMLGGNVYDRFMLGAAFYNHTIPSKRFEFVLQPMYAFGSKDIVGLGDIRYHIYSKKNNGRLTLGVNAKSFNQFSRDSIRVVDGFTSFEQKYLKIAPSISYEFPKEPKSHFNQKLTYRYLFINEEQATFDSLGNFIENIWENRTIHELTYSFANKRALNPFSGNIQLEHQTFPGLFEEETNLRATAEFKAEYTYAENRGIYFRFYGGYFFDNTFRERAVTVPNTLNLVGQGFNDYKYDELYFGRNEQDGFWSRQIALRDGGLKAPFGSAINTGRSNNFVFAVNMKADLPQDLPLNLPLRPYFDLGYFKEYRPSVFNSPDFNSATQFWWSFGVALEWGDDLVGIYFPIVSSKTGLENLDDLYRTRGNYFSRISFHINFQKLNPWKIADEAAGL